MASYILLLFWTCWGVKTWMILHKVIKTCESSRINVITVSGVCLTQRDSVTHVSKLDHCWSMLSHYLNQRCGLFCFLSSGRLPELCEKTGNPDFFFIKFLATNICEIWVRIQQYLVNIGSDKGLVCSDSDNKPLPQPLLTKFYVISRPQRVKKIMMVSGVSSSHNDFTRGTIEIAWQHLSLQYQVLQIYLQAFYHEVLVICSCANHV